MDDSRPLAVLLVAGVVLSAYEAVFCHMVGSTPGKLATSLRVTSVGRDRIDQTDAWRRGGATAVATLAILAIPQALSLVISSAGGLMVGTAVLVIAAAATSSTFTSPVRRGIIDGFAGTVVVHVEAPGVLSDDDLAAREGLASAVVTTPWGPVASQQARIRARTARLDDSPALVVGLVGVLLLWSSGRTQPAVAATLAWVILWVADETWRICRLGATTGHLRHGLRVVDEDTGEAPAPSRSLARAVTLAIFSFVPPLLLVLLLWVRMSPAGRGPHDLVAGTLVIVTDDTDETARR